MQNFSLANLKEELKLKEKELKQMKEKVEMLEKVSKAKDMELEKMSKAKDMELKMSKAKDMELENLKKRVADYAIETAKVKASESEIPKLSKGIALSNKFP